MSAPQPAPDPVGLDARRADRPAPRRQRIIAGAREVTRRFSIQRRRASSDMGTTDHDRRQMQEYFWFIRNRAALTIGADRRFVTPTAARSRLRRPAATQTTTPSADPDQARD